MTAAHRHVSPTRAQGPVNDESAPFTAVRAAIEKLSDDQVRSLIRALVDGLVHGMIDDVAARADDIVDDVVDNITAQLSAVAQAIQPAARGCVSRQQDTVKRTCELCGRIGSRRFVSTPTGWRCAPSATKCIGHRRPASRGDTPRQPQRPTGTKRPAAQTDRSLKIVPAPEITARCQDCTRTWTLTGTVLQAAIDQHELKRGHLITVYDEHARELVEACP